MNEVTREQHTLQVLEVLKGRIEIFLENFDSDTYTREHFEGEFNYDSLQKLREVGIACEFFLGIYLVQSLLKDPPQGP